jgi:sec-independent protein translocase protein TatB
VFDIGFSELVLIALLALLLLGPQRLPEVARAAGRWMARLRNFVDNVRQDFDRELRSSELDELRKLKQELDETRRVIEESSGKVLAGINADLNAAAAAASLSSTPSSSSPGADADNAASAPAPVIQPPAGRAARGAKAKRRSATGGRARRPAASKKKHGRGKKAKKPGA